MLIRFICVFIVSIGLTGPAFPEVRSPMNIAGVKKVNAEGVVELAQQLPSLIIIDSRISMDRKHGYIEGSISLPDIKTSCLSLSKIIPNKISPVLFYCNGIKCGRSAKAVNIALGCNYKKLYWFRGGFTEWKEKKYPILMDN